MREDHAFGRPGRSAGGNDECVARLDIGSDAHRCAGLLFGKLREPLVDRERCIAVRPDALQFLDEVRPAGKVEGNETASHVSWLSD